MWILALLAGLVIGVFLGWYYWGRRADTLTAELATARTEHSGLKSRHDTAAAENSRLKAERDEAKPSPAVAAPAQIAAVSAPVTPKPVAAKPAKPKAAAAAPSKAPTKPTAKSSAKPASVKTATAKTAAPKPATPAPAAKAAAPTKPAAVKAAAPKKTAAAAKPAAAKKDNLQLLIGIGKVNEQRLVAAGVTSFSQIAKWTPADVEQIEKTLAFDGRIAREKWIEQATLLAEGNAAEFEKRFAGAAKQKV